MEPIVFEKSPLTLAEFTSINWKYLRKIRKIIFVLPVVMLIPFVSSISYLFAGGDGKFDRNALWMPLVILAFYIFTYYSYVKAFKKNYDNTPALSDGLTYTLSDDSIIMQGNAVNSVLPWPATFKKAVRINRWILLSSSGAAAYYLDTTQIITPATVTDIEQMFQRKGVKMVK